MQNDKNSEDPKKLLTLNHFSNKQITRNDQKKILNYLNNNIQKFDVVMVQDFGHGLINNKIADLISKNQFSFIKCSNK